MVRQILHIALAILLLVSITGLTVHRHYCGDALTGTALFADAGGCQEDSCDHCKDETVNCRLDVDLFGADAQDIPETNVLNISVTDLLTASADAGISSFQDILANRTEQGPSFSFRGIPMLQSFRC